jgi:FAD synthase
MKYVLVLTLVLVLLNVMYNFFKPIPETWSGNVSHGYGNASTIDWPTANMLNDGKFPVGVFTATSEYGSGIVLSSKDIVEIHINGFTGNLYYKPITLSDIKRYTASSIFKYYSIMACLITL